MPHLDIHQFICRSDNYGVLVHHNGTGATASIDAPDAVEIEQQLVKRGWQLTHIFTTHHHGDHTEGNLALQDIFGCQIIGPAAEAERVPGIRHKVRGGDSFKFALRDVSVIDTPGHTKGHIAYHIASDYLAFVGDTLFALGCGRILEGSAGEMWASLDRLRKLPGFTQFHCGHEYTLANAKFGLTIEPGNRALQQRAEAVARMRERGEMTLPATMAEECRTNVFLRPDNPEIRKTLGMEGASDAAVFAEIRRRKDAFRG